MTNSTPRPWLALAAGLCIAGAACGDAATGETTAGAAVAKTPVDAAVVTRSESIRALHDEVMPDRARLVRLQRDLARAPEQNLAYSSARGRLDAADEAMMTWMHTDRPLTELVDSLDAPALNAYLDERERSIRAVADSMRASMSFAEQSLSAQ